MSWFSRLKEAIHGEQQEQGHVHPRQDVNLPLGARIGGSMTLSSAPFVRHMAHGGLFHIDWRPEDYAPIKAISRLQVGGTKVYRYYTDIGTDEAPESFLQLFCDDNGIVLEAMYCYRLLRFIPETQEDQLIYTGSNGCGLGEQAFSLDRAQLEKSILSKEQINTALLGSSEGEFKYWRHPDICDPEIAHVPPLTALETRIDDAQGHAGLRQQVCFMPYVRTNDAGDEQLIISTEVIQSQNGQNATAIHVDFMLGVAIPLDCISIY